MNLNLINIPKLNGKKQYLRLDNVHHFHYCWSINIPIFPTPQVVNQFVAAISPKCALLVGSLPAHLHVPTLATGILIVTAQLFWHAHGQRPDFQAIQKCLGFYCTSGTADAVRNAVREGFKTAMGPYTQESALMVLRIIMGNLGEGFLESAKK